MDQSCLALRSGCLLLWPCSDYWLTPLTSVLYARVKRKLPIVEQQMAIASISLIHLYLSMIISFLPSWTDDQYTQIIPYLIPYLFFRFILAQLVIGLLLWEPRSWVEVCLHANQEAPGDPRPPPRPPVSCGGHRFLPPALVCLFKAESAEQSSSCRPK